MGKKRQKSSSENAITDVNDPVVACFQRDNYPVESFKAPALGWFIQFAIRADFAESRRLKQQFHEAGTQLLGYPELFSRREDLLGLVREKHLIDESDLARIGMSLYDFPTLSHFFVAPKRQSCVREATVRELEMMLTSLRQFICVSGLSKYVPGGDPQNPTDENIYDLVANMTPTQVKNQAKNEVGIASPELLNEKFFVIDMAAPVTVLKEQFLQALERTPKKMNDLEGLYKAWKTFGVLPHIDMREWETEHGLKVRRRVRAGLIYQQLKSGKYDVKTIDDSTEPHAVAMLDVNSPAFHALTSGASVEFAHSVAFARGLRGAKSAIAAEAFERWFPRTYPYNMPDLKRAALMWPETAKPICEMLNTIESGGSLELSVGERIRSLPIDHDDGTGLLRARMELTATTERASPQLPESIKHGGSGSMSKMEMFRRAIAPELQSLSDLMEKDGFPPLLELLKDEDNGRTPSIISELSAAMKEAKGSADLEDEDLN
jgi:hypothetical protein